MINLIVYNKTKQDLGSEMMDLVLTGGKGVVNVCQTQRPQYQFMTAPVR